MLAGIYHGWPTRLETQANTPERLGRVRSSRVGGVHILQQDLAVAGELGACAIPWFQILEVFVCGLAQRNGHILKLP
jgi:hypothetical protein